MRIALAQLNPLSGDLAGNTRQVIDALSDARSRGAELLVAPEMVLPGYYTGDLVEDADFLAANLRAVQEVAAAAHGITAVVGFIDSDPNATDDSGRILKHNAAAVVRDGVVIQRVHKSLLPNYRYFDDKRWFTPADHRAPVDVIVGARSRRLGVSICEDMWDAFYDVKPLSELTAQGSEILLNINASPFTPGKRQERDAIIREHIKRLRKPFVYVNTVGASDNGKNVIPFDGESLVYDATGRLLAIGKQFEEQLLIVDVPDVPTGGASSAPAIDLPPPDREREIYDALLLGLRDYTRKTGFSRAIVPVSGGIDSALALAIVVDALGADRVVAYNMPSPYNTPTTRGIAERLACALGVKYGVIPIDAIDEQVRGVFEHHAHPIARGFTRENLHARIRGLLMMAESNDTGALLISCGNETEIALGYATLYGDMCGGLSLIGDLSKVDVYNLARYVNVRHGAEKIPEEAFQIKPSAELASGQFDPFDYPVVAPVVGELVERRRSPSEVIRQFERRGLDASLFPPDIYEKYTAATFAEVVSDCARRIRQSVYKRLQGPPIVVVSERAFGFDLRESIINGWKG